MSRRSERGPFVRPQPGLGGEDHQRPVQPPELVGQVVDVGQRERAQLVGAGLRVRTGVDGGGGAGRSPSASRPRRPGAERALRPGPTAARGLSPRRPSRSEQAHPANGNLSRTRSGFWRRWHCLECTERGAVAARAGWLLPPGDSERAVQCGAGGRGTAEMHGNDRRARRAPLPLRRRRARVGQTDANAEEGDEVPRKTSSDSLDTPLMRTIAAIALGAGSLAVSARRPAGRRERSGGTAAGRSPPNVQCGRVVGPLGLGHPHGAKISSGSTGSWR